MAQALFRLSPLIITIKKMAKKNVTVTNITRGNNRFEILDNCRDNFPELSSKTTINQLMRFLLMMI